MDSEALASAPSETARCEQAMATCNFRAFTVKRHSECKLCLQGYITWFGADKGRTLVPHKREGQAIREGGRARQSKVKSKPSTAIRRRALVCEQGIWGKKGGRTVSQLRGKDVLGCDQKLLSEVCCLCWTVGQELQHPFHHLLRVLGHQLLWEEKTTVTLPGCQEKPQLSSAFGKFSKTKPDSKDLKVTGLLNK
jgi:hypothetical protein